MRRSFCRCLLLLCGLISAALPAGCYSRVVGAQGFGADRVAVENGNVNPDKGTRTLGYPKYEPKGLPGQ